MRANVGGLAVALLANCFVPAFAQPQVSVGEPPAAVESQDGWTSDSAGHAHALSETKCPLESDAFKQVRFSGAAEPNIIGTCLYEDAMGTGDAGITVRRYMQGVGDSPDAIANDRLLMEPNPTRGAPLFTVRIDPVMFDDGKRGARMTITKMRGGLLIDCFAVDADFANAGAKIAALCAK